MQLQCPSLLRFHPYKPDQNPGRKNSKSCELQQSSSLRASAVASGLRRVNLVSIARAGGHHDVVDGDLRCATHSQPAMKTGGKYLGSNNVSVWLTAESDDIIQRLILFGQFLHPCRVKNRINWGANPFGNRNGVSPNIRNP